LFLAPKFRCLGFSPLPAPSYTQTQYYPDGDLADAAAANARTYEGLLAAAADAAMPAPTRDDVVEDVFDVLQRQVGED